MRDKVRRGYERADYHEEYREWKDVSRDERELLASFLSGVPEDGHIVDMGCGTGIPYDRFLVDEGYDVTGIDFTEKHIETARQQVPEASFLNEDFTRFDPDTCFDGLVSFFAILHVPREERPGLFERFCSLLHDRAPVLVTFGKGEAHRKTDDFAGAETVWSTYPMERNRDIVEEAGFEIIETKAMQERDDMMEHVWVLAQNDR